MRKYKFDPQSLDLLFPNHDNSYENIIPLHSYILNFMEEAGVELWGSIRPPATLHEDRVIVEYIVRDAIVSEVFKWLADDHLTGNVSELAERVDVVCALYRSEIQNLKSKLIRSYLDTIHTMWDREAACHSIATVADGESQNPSASKEDTELPAGK